MFLVVRILLILFLLAAPARAEELHPLPDLSKDFDLTAYAKATDSVTKDFPNIPNGSFKLSLPKSWMERVAIGQDYGEIARFDGPAIGDVRPYFSYKRMQLPRENTAKLELISYLLRSNYTLRSMREIDDRNVEAMYVLIDEHNDSYVVRSMMRIIGPDAYLAEYAVPVTAWDNMRDAQTFAVRSFKFLKDSAEAIEKRTERTYFKSVRFYYPASWVFEGEEIPSDNMVVQKLASKDRGNQLSGNVRLTVISTRSLKDTAVMQTFNVSIPPVLRGIRKMYETKGFIIDESLESRKPALNVPVTFSTMNVYNLRERLTQYDTDQKAPVTKELWIAVFTSTGPDAKTYVAELFTPSRNTDMYSWSTNTRAFEIILKSIQ